MFLLTQRWTEPCGGSAVYMIDITDEEVDRLRGVLSWLEEKAGDEYGGALSAWDLIEKEQIHGGYVYTDIDTVLSRIALESRYNETEEPGSFYGGRHPDLDNRDKVLC